MIKGRWCGWAAVSVEIGTILLEGDQEADRLLSMAGLLDRSEVRVAVNKPAEEIYKEVRGYAGTRLCGYFTRPPAGSGVVSESSEEMRRLRERVERLEGERTGSWGIGASRMFSPGADGAVPMDSTALKNKMAADLVWVDRKTK